MVLVVSVVFINILYSFNTHAELLRNMSLLCKYVYVKLFLNRIKVIKNFSFAGREHTNSWSRGTIAYRKAAVSTFLEFVSWIIGDHECLKYR